MIGGSGERVTLRIVAKYADEWNGFGSPEEIGHKMEVLDRHCADLGRDPSEIERSVAMVGEPAPKDDLDAVKGLVRAYAEVGVHEVLLPDSAFGDAVAQKRDVMSEFVDQVVREFR